MARHGATEEARVAAATSLTLHRATSDPWGVPLALSGLGKLAQADNDLATAAARFVEGLRVLIDAGVTRALPGYVEHVAGVALASGQTDRAARLAGADESQRASVGIARSASDWAAGTVDLAGLRTGPQAAAWAKGGTLPLAAVFAEATARAEEIAHPGTDQAHRAAGTDAEESPAG